MSYSTGKYNSIAEIVADPYGPGLAYAQDMSYTDWCNFNIKNFVIRERVLNQVVNVNIDGKLTPLTNPDTNMPLKYNDFVTDRSGPKFSGYLNEQPATEYLKSSIAETTRSALIDEQRQKTIAYCEKENLPIPPPIHLDNALEMFDKLHNSQRKLSDFDLTAQDTGVLERAIVAELNKNLDPPNQKLLEQSPQLSAAIGKTAWQEGGIINTGIIKEFLAQEIPSSVTYMDKVKATMIHPNAPDYIAPGKTGHDPERAFTHMLIEDVGKTVRAEYVDFYDKTKKEAPVFYQNDSSGVPDTFYGLGIPFNEAAIKSINRNGEMTLSTAHDDIEIGDIICDNSSIFGKIFNANQNFSTATEKLLAGGITPEQLEDAKAVAQKSSESQSEFFVNTLDALKQNSTLSPEQKQTATTVANDFDKNEKFISSGLMFEEAGKKEAQSQLFKNTGNTKKLIGNISDTGAFMKGVDDAAKDTSNPEVQATAKAHQQMTTLSTLINVSRWGINQENHEKVGDTQNGVKLESFQQSLNSRSYTAEESTGIREKLGWADIKAETAQQRLNEYHEGFTPVWKSVNENSSYYQAVEQYKDAKNNLRTAEASGDESKIAKARFKFEDKNDVLKETVEDILVKQMPELTAKIDSLGSQNVSRATVVNSLVSQIDEAVEFGQNRVLIDQKRAEAKAQAAPVQEIHPKPEVQVTPPQPTNNSETGDFVASLSALSKSTSARMSEVASDMSAKVGVVAKETASAVETASNDVAAKVKEASSSTVEATTSAAAQLRDAYRQQFKAIEKQKNPDEPSNDQSNNPRMG